MPKVKLLIISTYDIPCGIASFAATLKSLLDDDFEVTVAPLDPDVLKRFPKTHGDAAIRKIASEAKKYDVVNLQLEWGTLGSNAAVIVKRFKILMAGCGKLIVTLHTPIYSGANAQVRKYLKKLQLLKAAKLLITSTLRRFYEYQKISAIKKTSQRLGDNFHLIVHTERERKIFKELYRIQNVHAHPLSHIHAHWPKRLQKDAPAFRQSLLNRFGVNKKLIGFFGFISPYKGLETALGAIDLLPEEYILLVFGSSHPETIEKNRLIDPYLAYILTKLGFSGYIPSIPGGNSQKTEEVTPMRKKDAVFFMGAPDDYEFATAIAAMDACVFPHVEVGQSGSGPVSLAIELQKATFISRTLAFLELKKYFPQQFAMFDIGNSVQLAQQLHVLEEFTNMPPSYTKDTQRRLYADLVTSIAKR